MVNTFGTQSKIQFRRETEGRLKIQMCVGGPECGGLEGDSVGMWVEGVYGIVGECV